MKYRLAILTTTINPDTIAEMVTAASAAATHHQADIVSVTATVGCLDMPVIAQMLFKNKKIDGLVVLGAVAQGETKHDDLVVQVMTTAIVNLSLQYNKPVGFGVIGPGAKPSQFKSRTVEYATRAVEAVVNNLNLLK